MLHTSAARVKSKTAKAGIMFENRQDSTQRSSVSF